MRIEHARQIIQRLVAALVKGPASDRLADRLERFVAGRRLNETPTFPPRRRDSLGLKV